METTRSARSRIALLSPFHGGSHRAWAEGFAARSTHDVQVLSLPDQFWKWRMHGAAVSLARMFEDRFVRPVPPPAAPEATPESGPPMASPAAPLATPARADSGDPSTRRSRPDRPPELILATDMCDLAATLAILRRSTAAPAVLYVHENQLTYPLPADPATGPMRRQHGERDRHYAWINVTSMLAADLVLFNSAYHRDEFLAALPAFLRHVPDQPEPGITERIRNNSEVLPIGLGLECILGTPRVEPDPGTPPLIIWNQRWEYDKAPERFFRALYRVSDRGIDFRLAVCGENLRQNPAEFDEARERLAGRIIHWGFAGADEYLRLLSRAEVTASTALHEFFGIAVVECMAAGVFPLLPDRLNYPHLVPVHLHGHCLYDSAGPDGFVAQGTGAGPGDGRGDGAELEIAGLVERLVWVLEHRQEAAQIAAVLRETVRAFDWTEMAPRYDARLRTVMDRQVVAHRGGRAHDRDHSRRGPPR